ASVSNETAPAPEGSSTSNFALLIFRLACALPVLYHGSGILFGAFGGPGPRGFAAYLHLPMMRSEEHTSELQSRFDLVCRLLLEYDAHLLDPHSFPTRRSSDLGFCEQ